ncbi:MAG TPA: tetratricopeptide repeat protein [Opitutaceae bacterium]|nr:tetratricopeptide repeat protein [Opitutaceae bacterium]
MERRTLRPRTVASRLARGALLLVAALGTMVAPLTAADHPPAGPAGENAARTAGPENINISLAKALAALSARNWDEAATTLKQLIAANPDVTPWEYYQALGAAQTGLREYPNAIQSFEKGLAIARDHPDPKADRVKLRAGIAQMLTAEGNVCLKLRKPDDAVALYTQAAAISPDPATAYFNICATLYNAGEMPKAAAAADRAIAVDPQKADAYFIKGSALFADGKSEGGRYVAPPESVAALKKYLKLAPTGPHADDVRALLAVTGSAPAN